MAVTLKLVRDLSSIAFPYLDLDDAISLARKMHDLGGVPMDRDQLAAAMGQVPSSGNFNNKVSAARLFGLIENNSGRYQLTALGFNILDSARAASAKAEAFLNVPLYKRVYDEFKGKQLPPRPVGLEQAFVNFGVAPKQKDKARHAFDRSARAAGFFPSQAEDRLVQPVVGAAALAPTDEGGRGTAPDNGLAVDFGAATVQGSAHTQPSPLPPTRILNPFIEGLLDEIPKKGTPWTIDDQANWLQAAAQIFRILYKGDGEIMVTVKKGTPAP